MRLPEGGTMPVVAAEPIAAARLDLVPLRPAHAAEMAAVLASPALHEFTGGAPPTLAELRDRYERWAAGSSDPDVSWCNWVIRLRETGSLAGWVQATVTGGVGVGDPSAEVAWVVGVPWQGQGIATEAARALIAWLRQRPVRVITAHIHPDHAASAAVARDAGLAPTGVLEGGEVRWQSPASPAAGR
jgi:RimJ/RimL family protein N-acetyltransferase